MTTPGRFRRRELEQELADIPTPPPPSELLDRIRGEIPSDLLARHSTSVAGNPATPRLRRPLLRLAASLAVVAASLSIATRILDRPSESKTSEVASETRAVAVETFPVAERSRTPKPEVAPAPASPDVPPRSVRRGESDRSSTRGSHEAGRRVATPPSSATTAPVAPEAEEAELKARVAEIREKLQELRRPDSGGRRAASTPAGAVAQASPQDRRTIDEFRDHGEPLATDRVGAVEEARPATDPFRLLQTDPGLQADRIAVAPPSTGGTVEPNDAAYGDMFFRPTGTHPFVDTAEDRLSTFALDVDTGSWTLARSYFDRGALPPAAAIRVEEFVNAQSYDDPAPRRGDFTLVAEGAPSPFAPGANYRLVRFAVKGREIATRNRRPAHLTFVVDVSGSMRRENRLGLVKRALALLIRELGPEDRVALVVYGSRGRVLLRPTRDLFALREAIATLVPEGSTNAEDGLRLAYDLAGEMFRPDAANRVILCSDGVANVGASGPESILETIGVEARRGIELTTVGFGMGNYNDVLMEQLADQGDGRYHYVDSLAEARRIFVENLTGTLETIAEDAKVQVEFDPSTVERWRLLGYENRAVADRDFRNDRIDAGEIGPGHSAVALYEVRLAPRARGRDRLATLHLRWRSTATRSVEEAPLELRVRDLDPSFRRASANLRRAAIAAELAEMLKDSFYAQDASWRALAEEAFQLERDLADPRVLPKLSDLAESVERAAELSTGREGTSARED